MATKAVPGKRASVYVDGMNASPYLNEYEVESEGEDLDVTPLESDGKEFITGSIEHTVTLTGFWNGDPDSLDRRLRRSSRQGVPNIITICPGGVTSGKDVLLAESTLITNTVSGSSDDMNESEAEFKSVIVDGQVLKTPGVITATGSTTPKIDPDGISNSGLMANLHVTALTGTPTSVVIEVEQSADGTVWSPVLEFEVDGKGGQVARTLPTDTIQAQLRATATITGGTTPTLNYMLAAGRATN